MTRSFDVFFDLRLNKRLSKQPWGWWFETPAWSLWRHRNESVNFDQNFLEVRSQSPTDNNTNNGMDNGFPFCKQHFHLHFLEYFFLSVLIKISLHYILRDPTERMSLLVQVIAWCQTCTKPFSELMMPMFEMPYDVTRLQWVNMNVKPVNWEVFNPNSLYGIMGGETCIYTAFKAYNLIIILLTTQDHWSCVVNRIMIKSWRESSLNHYKSMTLTKVFVLSTVTIPSILWVWVMSHICDFGSM